MSNIVNNSKYFNFPLNFLRNLDNDRLEMICGWSIMDYSKRVTYDIKEVARQVIYANYRHWSDLPYNIKNTLYDMEENERIELDDQYNGFDTKANFDPQNGECEAILKEFETDNEFRDNCISFYQWLQTRKILNIVGGDFDKNCKDYDTLNTTLNEFESVNGNDVRTGVNIQYLFDASEARKQILPINFFRLVCAVSSIIGARNFNKTYKSVILSRMFGAKHPDLILPEDKERYDFLFSMKKRRQWRNLLSQAEHRKLITYIPANKGYFVAIKYDYKQLISEIKRRTVMKGKTKFIQYPRKLQLHEIDSN